MGDKEMEIVLQIPKKIIINGKMNIGEIKEIARESFRKFHSDFYFYFNNTEMFSLRDKMNLFRTLEYYQTDKMFLLPKDENINYDYETLHEENNNYKNNINKAITGIDLMKNQILNLKIENEFENRAAMLLNKTDLIIDNSNHFIEQHSNSNYKKDQRNATGMSNNTNDVSHILSSKLDKDSKFTTKTKFFPATNSNCVSPIRDKVNKSEIHLLKDENHYLKENVNYLTNKLKSINNNKHREGNEMKNQLNNVYNTNMTLIDIKEKLEKINHERDAENCILIKQINAVNEENKILKEKHKLLDLYAKTNNDLKHTIFILKNENEEYKESFDENKNIYENLKIEFEKLKNERRFFSDKKFRTNNFYFEIKENKNNNIEKENFN